MSNGTRTASLEAVVRNTTRDQLLAELVNRKARGTGGNLERFINTMHSKYVAPSTPKAKDCEPVVKAEISALKDKLIKAINSAF